MRLSAYEGGEVKSLSLGSIKTLYLILTGAMAKTYESARDEENYLTFYSIEGGNSDFQRKWPIR